MLALRRDKPDPTGAIAAAVVGVGS
jgi:hypothetical protein